MEINEIREFNEISVLYLHFPNSLDSLHSLNSLNLLDSPQIHPFSLVLIADIHYLCIKCKLMNDIPLIKQQGDHRNLISYRKAELIYDITYYFAHAAFERSDRTIDQMVQAARSGKQNIVEGNADVETSIEMGIKLINVAKASFKELLADYEDYLRVNNHEQWSETSEQYMAMRQLGRDGTNLYILEIVKSRPLHIVANMAIILIKQEDYLLYRFLESLSKRFIQEGGFREKMHRMRVDQRAKK